MSEQRDEDGRGGERGKGEMRRFLNAQRDTGRRVKKQEVGVSEAPGGFSLVNVKNSCLIASRVRIALSRPSLPLDPELRSNSPPRQESDHVVGTHHTSANNVSHCLSVSLILTLFFLSTSKRRERFTFWYRPCDHPFHVSHIFVLSSTSSLLSLSQQT